MSSRNHFSRPALLARTALASATILLVATQAQAQSTVAGTIGGITGNGAGATVVSNSPGNSTVTLGNSRTILDWNSFNLSNGNSLDFVFGGRSDVVLNRVNSGAATVNGSLRGSIGAAGGATGGNVWFSAPGGVVFGSTAVLNVGGLLATTGSIANADFFDGNQSFTFTGAANGMSVANGAQLNVSGGTLALIAPTISSAGAINDTSADKDSDALFGAATEYTITFAPDAEGDLDLMSWTVPASGLAASSTPITIAGTIAVGNIYIGAVTSQTASLVINPGAVVSATGAAAGGDGKIILSAGGGIVNKAAAANAGSAAVGVTVMSDLTAASNLAIVGNSQVTATAGSDLISSAGNVSVKGGNTVTLRTISATSSVVGDVTVESDGNVSVETVNGGRNVALTANGGNVDVSGPLNVGGNYAVRAGDFIGNALSPNFGTGTTNSFTITDTVGGFFTGVRSAPGSLTINVLNGGGLTVSGALTATNGNLTLATTGGGDIDIEAAISAPAAPAIVALNSSGAVRQTAAGVVTTPWLQGSAVGAFGLATATNQLTYLGAITANGVSVRDASGGLQIAGNISGGNGGVTITTPGLFHLSARTISSTGDIISLTGGSMLFDQGTVSNSAGNISLTGPLSLSATNTITAGGASGTATFNSTVNGDPFPALDVLIVNGGAVFNAAVGATQALNALTVNGSTAINGGSVQTTDQQAYIGAVTLGANTTLTSTASGAILLDGTVDGARSLTVNTAGLTRFSADVGSTAALTSIATNAGGSTRILAGSVRTSGAQTYGDAVQIGTGLHTINSSSAVFANAVNQFASGATLSITTSGATSFANTVSGLTGLGIDAATVSFTGLNNRVGTLAAKINAGGLFFGTDASLTIGTVNGLVGITAAAGQNIGIETPSATGAKTLTLAAPINASGGGDVSIIYWGGSLQGSGLISADHLLVALNEGVGNSGNRVQTAVNSMSVAGGNQGVFLNEADAVTLRTTTIPACSGTCTSDINNMGASYDLVAGGTITVSTFTWALGGISLMSGGNIVLGMPSYDRIDTSGDLRLTAAGTIQSLNGAPLYARDIYLSAADFAGGVLSASVLQETNNVSITDTLGGSFISAAVGLSAANGLTIATTNGGGLSVGGVAAPGFITLTSAGNLDLTGNISGGAGLVTLNAATAISQSAGIITAGLLGGNAVGAVNLNQMNAVTSLGNFTANGLIVRNGGQLSIIGALSGGAGGVTVLASGDLTLASAGSISSATAGSDGPISLTASGVGSDIFLNGYLNADTGTVALNAGASISQTSASVIVAGRLQGSSGSGAAFNGSGNQVSELGNFTTGTVSSGGFLLVNGRSLATLAGTTVNSSNAPLEIRLLGAGSDLTLRGTLNAGNGTVSLYALGVGGDITQIGGAIRAAVLTGSSAGSTSLTSSAFGANAVGALATFDANGFSFAQDGGISVNGAISGGLGGLALNSVNGGVAINASGTLSSAGLVDVDAGGAINVDGSVNSATAVDLQAAGLLSITGGGQIGSVGNVRLASSGNAVAIGGAGVSAAGILNLVSSAGVSQTAAISAGTLTGNSGGPVELTLGTNQIGNLGTFTANRFRLADIGGLTVTGAVDGGAQEVTLSTTGDLAVNAAISSNLYVVLRANGPGADILLNAAVNGDNEVGLSADGLIAQTSGGAITATNFYATASGAVTLSAANNHVSNLLSSGGDGFQLSDVDGLHIAGTVNGGSGGVLIQTLGGDLTIGSAAGLLGSQVVLSTDQDFINNSGADAISGGQWLIYSAGPAGNSFGGLDSGNTAVWNATLASKAPATLSGNRYVFAYQPTLTFTSLDASKTYGTGLSSSGFSVAGLHPGIAGAFLADTLATAYTGTPTTSSAGFAANASVAGGPYAITIGSGTVASASGYALSFVSTGQLTVHPKALNGTVTANNKTYDGTTAATGSVALNGVVNGDQVTASALLAFADKNAGNGKTVTISGGSLSGADAGNYTLSLPASTLANILKLAISGTVSANDKTYDGTTDATGSVTLNGVLNGDQVTASALIAFADKNAGNGKTVTISGGSLSGADAGNYSLSLPASTLANIFKRAINGTVTANNKTYDGTTAATGSVALNGVVNGDQVSASALLAFADKNAGNGKTVTISGGSLSGTDAGNYTLSLPASTLANIARAGLTITANSLQKDQGTEEPVLTYAITVGQLFGDDQLSGALARVAGEIPGDYAILQGSLAASLNYEVTFVPGTLTISPRILIGDTFRDWTRWQQSLVEATSDPIIVVEGKCPEQSVSPTSCEAPGGGY